MKRVSEMDKAEKIQLVRDYTNVHKYNHVRAAFDDLMSELDIRINQEIVMESALNAIKDGTEIEGMRRSADIALDLVKARTKNLPHR